MLFTFLLSFAACDELFDAFVHQNFSELVLSYTNVELSLRSESIFQCLIVVIKIEVKLSEQISNKWSIMESLIFV